MAKSKKILSIALTLALLLSSVFVGGLTASASLDDLYITVNNYDDIPDGIEFSEVTADKYAATNLVIGGSPEMEDANNLRHFSAYGSVVSSLPTELGTGNAVHFTSAGSGDKSDPYQAIVRLYKDDSSTLAHFAPTAGKTYEVKLRYYVAKAPNKEIQLQIRTALYSQCSYQYPNDEDATWMEPVVIASITEATVGWYEATAYFTARDPARYINLSLSSATSGSASNVDVWVDDITVAECAKMTVHNYTPDNNKAVPVSKVTTIADLQPDVIDGYRFGGVFSDEGLTNRLSADDLAGSYTELYFAWLPITINDFYCGFEDYSQPVKNTAYNSSVSEITTDDAYVGRYSMKNTLGTQGIAAFEIKNANSFSVVKNRNYTVSLAYKSDADIELYLGLGKLGNFAATAKAVSGQTLDASDEWKTVTLTVTPDKSTDENYVLGVMLYAKNGAAVFVDDILLSGVLESYVNPTLNTGFTPDWYPGLALFEGVELPEIWGGQSDLSEPKDTDADGVYEITNGAELAYAISNGGGEDAKFILTKDIYLNDINAINWKTGEVIAEGYTPNTWYNQSVSFQGSIDGDGHTIYGMYRKDNPSSMISYAGYGTALVPKVPDNGTVAFTNLAVDYAFINVECGAAAFVGTTQCTSQGATSITVDGCYVGENVQLNGGDAGAFVGYTGGSGCKLIFNNSYSLATTSGTAHYGLAAVCYQATLLVNNCFNANGPVTSYTNGNWTGNYTIKNTYQTEESGTDKYYYPTNFETISADNMKGTDVFSEGKMEYLNLSNAYVATEGFPKLAFFEGIEIPEIWDGSVATEFAGGSGTEADPYQIENGAQLAYAVKNGGLYSTDSTVKYFVITKDIYLNNIGAVNWETGEAIAEGYTPNAWYKSVSWSWGVGKQASENFQGHIDGNGNTIYGIYFHSTSDDYSTATAYGTGLIPCVIGETTIKNLKISNSHILSNYSGGAFIGTERAGTTTNIDRCYATESVYIKGYAAGVFSGAVDSDAILNLTNSGSLATVSEIGEYGSYGLIAFRYQGKAYITNCFNANGPLSNYWDSNWNSIYRFENCYQTAESGQGGSQSSYDVTTITADKMQGLDVFDNASKMPNLNADEAFTATEDFPVVSVFIKETASDEEGAEEEETEITVWDGTVAESFANGDGTAENPYVITNGAELALAISKGGQVSTDGVYTDEAYFNKYFVIANDIYLNDLTKINWITGAVSAGYTAKPWLKHENFAGNIDGQGHTVYGLYYKDGATKYASYPWGMGLVPYVVNGNTVTISNLGIDNCFIYYECGAAAFVGTLNNGSNAYIDSCYVGGNVYLDGADAGAFRGYSSGGTTSVIKSYTLATVKGGVRTNGLIGDTNGTNTASYCYNANGVIKGSSLTNCYQSTGTDSTGVKTIPAQNMKGDDVLTNPDKMPLLAFASAFVSTQQDFSNHDYYIYLPIGTIITEDFAPTFSDSFLTGVDKAKVMEGNTLKRGAYIKFEKEPASGSILVPNALASFIRQGSYETVSSDPICDKHYGIDAEVVSKQISEQSEDALNYIFITDIHFMNYDLSWDTQGNILLEQISLITDMANDDENIDFIVVGGDSVQGFWDTKEGWKNAITKVFEGFKTCEKPVFVTMGNHDDNAYATWNENYGEKVISDLDWKNYVLDPISPADIVRPEGDPNAKNYYYDLEKNGKTTRLFFLDAIDYYQEYDENGTITALEIRTALGYTEESAEDYSKYYNGRSYLGYSASQIKWVADSLAETDKFDDVIVFSHMGTDANTSSTEFGTELAEVMAAYNNKTAYKNDALGIDVSYTDNGRILAYQFGHIHREVTVYNHLAEVWQIGSSTARTDQAAADAGRKNGTATEACFDVMSVTPEAIRKFNIGGGEDGLLVNKSAAVYGDLTLDKIVDIRDLVALSTTEEGTSTAADVNRDNLIVFTSDAEAIRKIILGK